MKGRTPTAAEKRYMAQSCALGCIVCWMTEGVQSPASPHHLEGKTKPGAHFRSIPLCFEHHQSGVNSDRYVSVHPWKAEFYRRYGSEQELLNRVFDMLGLNPDDVANG